jgi:CHAT domain-containing protein
VLLDVMGRSEVLYIVPDSRLYLVPFSALTLNDAPLHDYCALALAPSVGLWQWCRARRPIEQTRTCLAIGVGQEDRVSFADQTRAVMAGCNWKKAPTYLLDDEVPVRSDGVWELAKKHTVIHFSCHGMEEPTALDTLSALYLELSGKEKFYAKDVFNRKDELFAELVFLNACMSGRFKLRKGLAIGGFWEAFLQAGATSLIATLAKVHPEDAEQLAHTFYKAWLEQNVSKARALQLAQQELRRKKTKSFHWARYVLIGDHR